MKSFQVTSFCLALLMFAGSARALAAPAAEDDLFGAAPTPAIEESPAAPIASSAPRAVSQAPTSGYAARAQWHDGDDSAPQLNATTGAKPHEAQREAAPSSPITVVPEPSAVILALAALVYFLLFGRRRAV